MRHPEPKWLIDWRAEYEKGPPRCCHTCEHYGVDGLCVEFFMKPPENFAATLDACDKWECEVPF